MYWNLRRRVTLSGGEVSYDVLGYGPPVILVHGTPSRSYIWRDVAMTLANRFSVYVFDLLGFGHSERREGLDVSIKAQARLLVELIDVWGLEAPLIAGHDIGGGIVLRANLIEGVPFGCIALIDSVVLRPWITPTTRHVKAHLDVYATMPAGTFEGIVASHLRTATHRPMDEDSLATYLEGWKGEFGQKLYLQKDAQLDEAHTAEFEPLLPAIEIPVRIIWGEHDAWLPPNLAERLHGIIPTSDLVLLPETGHFAMEDSPREVTAALFEFFTGCSGLGR
ncbi:MAG TPA: alpha/beta hydrolase [Rubrobacter sp.]|nr:alpha/beta hydrolase [Rubrobacter sp.]